MTAPIAMTCNKRKILLTGARSPAALDVARLLHCAGHEVYTADTSFFHICRFSNAVKNSFVVPAPSDKPEKFIQSVIEIIKKVGIDILIPIWEEVLYISKEIDRFPKSCQVFCSSFEMVDQLHNKFHFIELQKKFNIEVPETYLVKSTEELKNLPFKKPYVLKACYCRGSQKIRKVNPGEDPLVTISPQIPWVAQEWIEGEKFCSYSVCHNGEIKAHVSYPVVYTMEDKSSCLAFEAQKNVDIYEWAKNLIQKINYTGQAAFDFIETEEGKMYAIECNPRATSGVHLFAPKDRIDLAYMDENEETILPEEGRSRQIAAGMVIYGWKLGCKEKKLGSYVKKTFSTRDVVFSLNDIKPFVAEPLILVLYWITSLKKHSTIPKIFTHDFDWNGRNG